MEINDYRAYNALNYSSLSKLSHGPKHFKESREEVEYKDYFSIGSMVDCLLTNQADFNKRFYILKAKMPTDMMCKYINSLIETGDEKKAYEASGYKTSMEKVKERFEGEGKEYFEELKNVQKREIVSYEDYSKAVNVAKAFRESEYTGIYFSQRSGIELMYQVPVYWYHSGEPCKSLLDIVEIDHNSKNIRPLDIKTTGKPLSTFVNSYRVFKYYLQGSFYTGALEYAIKISKIFPDYKIVPFRFLVAEVENISPPVIFEMSYQDLEIAKTGKGMDIFENDIKGWQTLVEEYKYYKKNDRWDYSLDLIENQGTKLLNIFMLK